jgi:hypothetical protein
VESEYGLGRMAGQTAHRVSKYDVPPRGWAIKMIRRACIIRQRCLHSPHSVKNLPRQYMTPDSQPRFSRIHILLSFPEHLAEYSFSDQRPKDLNKPQPIPACTPFQERRCVSGQRHCCIQPSARITAHQKARISIKIGRSGRVDGQRRSDHRRSSGNRVMSS